MSVPAVRVSDLSKQYHLGTAGPGYTTLRDSVRSFAGASLRTLLRRGRQAERKPTFWALQDVSFEIQPGEVVGIIGRNGAGKSTLLKILSRITEPTKGEAEIRGRVGSLLEVGTGFHPELTGRENIFLNGAILGMRRGEILKNFDQIVAFAEVEKFIDTPVKHYSSGMYMRLAFAVAAHLETEILIVDEVLAVGDAEFQKKCLGKMGDVAKQGRTVLFVSHNLAAIKSLCTRAMLLSSGQIELDDTTEQCVGRYLALSQLKQRDGVNVGSRPGTGEWRYVQASATKSVFDPAEALEFLFSVVPTRSGASTSYLSGLLVNQEGTTISQFDSRLVGVWASGTNKLEGRLKIESLWLKPGTYRLDLFLCSHAGIIDQFEGAVDFDISQILPYAQYGSPDATAGALVLSDFHWRLNS